MLVLNLVLVAALAAAAVTAHSLAALAEGGDYLLGPPGQASRCRPSASLAPQAAGA